MTHAGADAAAVGGLAPAGAAAAGAPASAAEAAGAGPASASGAADSAAEAAACGGGQWQWVDVALAAAPLDSEAGSHGHDDPWDADASAGKNPMSTIMQKACPSAQLQHPASLCAYQHKLHTHATVVHVYMECYRSCTGSQKERCKPQ